MKHHACAAVIGLLTAALFSPVSQSHAASADPTGYWMKPDAERESKIHVFKCGTKRTNLCAKIAWLKDPNDRKGQPLHDVRNQNPSQRGRQIMGLPIFSQLVPSAPSTWTGKIYNPEDGQTYSATLTVVSRKQLLLKGCKAWLLCGERTWYRTSPPPAEVTPEAPADGSQQIEASVTPQLPEAAPPSAAAAVPAEPASVPSADATVEKASIGAAEAQQEMQAMTTPQMTTPQLPAEPSLTEAPAVAPEPVTLVTQEIASPTESPTEIDAGRGYGFLAVSPDADTTARLSGENVPSMMLMAKPIATEAAAPSTAQPAAKSAAVPAKPKAQPKPVATAAAKPVATPKPVATAAKPVATAAKPSPKAEPAAKSTEQATPAPDDGDAAKAEAASDDAPPAETADATLAQPVPLTRRERRQLRRQQREMGIQEPLLPWWR